MLKTVCEIVKQAGDIILHASSAPVHEKEGHFNFVTDTDVAVQEYLQNALSAH